MFLYYALRDATFSPEPCTVVDSLSPDRRSTPAGSSSIKKEKKTFFLSSFGSPRPSCWDPGAIPLQLQIAPRGRRRFHLFFCPLFLAKKLDLPDRVIHRGLTV